MCGMRTLRYLLLLTSLLIGISNPGLTVVGLIRQPSPLAAFGVEVRGSRFEVVDEDIFIAFISRWELGACLFAKPCLSSCVHFTLQRHNYDEAAIISSFAAR